ncbi:MAG: hypothetical protein OXO52_12185 [Rhodospirillales bacterium]|nr:hypothetical protein [Rhodospirillales bacterium]MDE0380267.1 hypothetical protein [Rhodospirillales bacterium]
MLQRLLVPALLASALAVPAAAEEESRYSEWRQDGAEAEGGEALDALARELEALIDDAEKARAADPRFLQDLRDMIAAHVAEAEPREALIRDDFSDGDYTDDPGWEVVSGEFSVESRLGLRTTIPLSGADTETMRISLDTIMETKDELLDKGEALLDKGKDTVTDLLSGEKTFGDLLGGDDDEEATEDTGPAGPEPAMIVLEADIPNAFALEVEMMSGVAHRDAQFEIDLFQGRGGASGYRLSYMAGDDPALSLSRFGRRGAEVIGEHDDALALEDGQSHTLALVREGDGTMTATVDGTELIRAKSSALEDPFDGLSLVNGGGDYAIRSVAVYGEQ